MAESAAAAEAAKAAAEIVQKAAEHVAESVAPDGLVPRGYTARHIYNNSDSTWRVEAKDGRAELRPKKKAHQLGNGQQRWRLKPGGELQVVYLNEDGGWLSFVDENGEWESHEWKQCGGIIASGELTTKKHAKFIHAGFTPQMNLNRPARGDVQIFGSCF